MQLRPAPLVLLALACAFAGDGIPPRGSADDYPVHQVSGKVAIGAAYVPPAQVKKLFGEDLDKRGYLVFEVGMFPVGDNQADVSPDDFKLRQGTSSFTHAATPHMVATDVHPQPSSTPDTQVPGKINVQTAETIGVYSGSDPAARGAGVPASQHGTYNSSSVSVSNYPPPRNAPMPGQSAAHTGLEQRLEDKALPDAKSRRAVAGYVFFPKPSNDRKLDYELIYSGMDSEFTFKLPQVTK